MHAHNIYLLHTQTSTPINKRRLSSTSNEDRSSHKRDCLIEDTIKQVAAGAGKIPVTILHLLNHVGVLRHKVLSYDHHYVFSGLNSGLTSLAQI